MDDTTKTLMPTAAPEAPAFFGPRWNGWALFALAIICILGFFVTQTVLLVFVLFREHPELFIYPARLQHQLQDPAFITNLLTAKNLWLISVLSEAVLALLTVGFARAAFRATSSTLGLSTVPKGGWVLWSFGWGLVLFGVSSVVELGLTAIFGHHPPQPQALALVKHHGAAQFALDFMSVSIAAPFAEELFFRGFIFGGLAQRMSPLLAMLISAAIFGGAHFEKWSFLPIFAIGVGLAWLYYATRSLWANMVAHATVNTISLVIAYTFPQLVK